MNQKEFCIEFGKLCLAKNFQPAEGAVEVWWEIVAKNSECIPALKKSFDTLSCCADRFMPTVGELIQLANSMLRRQAATLLSLPSPEPPPQPPMQQWTGEQIANAKQQVIAAIKSLKKNLSMERGK